MHSYLPYFAKERQLFKAKKRSYIKNHIRWSLNGVWFSSFISIWKQLPRHFSPKHVTSSNFLEVFFTWINLVCIFLFLSLTRVNLSKIRRTCWEKNTVQWSWRSFCYLYNECHDLILLMSWWWWRWNHFTSNPDFTEIIFGIALHILD